jgi:UDP-N-acetylmuramyl pentapeptide phosphotransferase/UDP-N-acetylglucosamine-1-phosphate transferase
VPALSKITLDWEDIKLWGPIQKAVVGLGAALVVFLGYSEYNLLSQVGVAKYYLIWIVAVIGFFVWNTKR